MENNSVMCGTHSKYYCKNESDCFCKNACNKAIFTVNKITPPRIFHSGGHYNFSLNGLSTDVTYALEINLRRIGYDNKIDTFLLERIRRNSDNYSDWRTYKEKNPSNALYRLIYCDINEQTGEIEKKEIALFNYFSVDVHPINVEEVVKNLNSNKDFPCCGPVIQRHGVELTTHNISYEFTGIYSEDNIELLNTVFGRAVNVDLDKLTNYGDVNHYRGDDPYEFFMQTLSELIFLDLDVPVTNTKVGSPIFNNRTRRVSSANMSNDVQ